ncbi:MAG: hypothetical protein AAF696_07620 [Bacteroidota bacterium]
MDIQDQSKRLKEEQKSRELYEEFVNQGKNMADEQKEEEEARLKREAEERLKQIRENHKTQRRALGQRLQL